MKVIRIIALASITLLTACGQVITPAGGTEMTVTSALTPTQAGALEATASPPPLPTPVPPTVAPTPTPITHVVQEGETLLSIALLYGVSVTALQQANGIEDPLLLQVGQELIIPTGGEATAPEPGVILPTPTPMLFRTSGVAFYETPVGSLWCLGEVVNTTDVPLINVLVRVTLADETGAALAMGDAFAAADIIPSGGRSPFGVLFTAPPPAYAGPVVSVVRGEGAGELAHRYVPIAVTEANGAPSGPQYLVSGTVQNVGEELAEGASVIVTTYDAEGFVTGFRQMPVEGEGTLVPGATASFSVLIIYYGDVPADFTVIAQARPRE